MSPLRILHCEAATGFGGQENRVIKEMRAMRAHGHSLEALCQPNAQLARRLRDEGFVVHTMPMGGPFNFVRGVARACGILRRGRFQVVNTHSRRDTLLVGLAARLVGIPLIVRTRHLAIRPGSLLSYTVVPHRVTTVSDFVRRLLIERGVPPDKVATVYTSVPFPPLVEHSTLRAELGLPANAVVVGCVAVLREKKGHRVLIDAMRDVLLRRPDVFLVLVGDGAPLMEKLREHVRASGLQGKVRFAGRRADIPNVLAGFDIFALATREEALGTSYIEAAAAGLPVVGTDVGGVSETMQDGVTGLLVPPDDEARLSDAIQMLVDHPALRCAMGLAGMRAVRGEGRFSEEHMVRETERCYGRWLQGWS